MKTEELDNLSTTTLIDMMDMFLINTRLERNPHYQPDSPWEIKIYEFAITNAFGSWPEENQRNFIWKLFDFTLQVEGTNLYLGMYNLLLDSPRFKQFGYKSATVQLELFNLNQSVIISSSTCFERLMHLLHYADTQTELKTSETFSNFKKYLREKDALDPFVYFVFFLREIREYIRKFRTAELHTGSKLKKRILVLDEFTDELSNDLLDLHNIMISIWRPLVDVLNGIRPGYMGGVRRSDTDWLQHFHLGNRLELELRKSEIIESLK